MKSICGAAAKLLPGCPKAGIRLGAPYLRSPQGRDVVAEGQVPPPALQLDRLGSLRWVFSLADQAIYFFLRCKSCLRTRPWQCLAGLSAQSHSLSAAGRHAAP